MLDKSIRIDKVAWIVLNNIYSFQDIKTLLTDVTCVQIIHKYNLKKLMMI